MTKKPPKKSRKPEKSLPERWLDEARAWRAMLERHWKAEDETQLAYQQMIASAIAMVVKSYVDGNSQEAWNSLIKKVTVRDGGPPPAPHLHSVPPEPTPAP